ncbi:MAG: hypothetical protein WCT23_06110 [Candidatus Neomarinimicrobiota bacterium]|jgi:hypothetical protein
MKKILILFIALLVLVSCDLFSGSGDDSHDQFLLSNNKEITIVGDTVYFYEEDPDSNDILGKTAKPDKKKKDIGYDVILSAKIPAVIVESLPVHANDIVIKGNKAYIAYNYAGEIFRGAIQIVDIGDKDEPEIIEEILMPSMDINALYIDGNDLIFGGAADPDIWNFKSFIGKINTKKIKPNEIAESITELPSHALTGIAAKGKYYHVTVGAEKGKLIKLSKKDFKIDKTLDLSDARDVEEYESGVVVISGTTDNTSGSGKVSIVFEHYNDPYEILINDFGSDYHKATIEVFEGNTALLALSEAGFKVVDLKRGRIVYEAKNPELADGLPYTNSVSSDDDLIFSANGEWGFRVFSVSGKKFDETNLVGYYPYDDTINNSGQKYSANHVEYKSKQLFVACGVGGVEVFYLEEDED